MAATRFPGASRLTRRLRAATLLVLLPMAAVSCRSAEPDPDPVTTTVTSPPSSTIPVAVTLPVDNLRRTPPIDATAAFAAIGPQPSFDQLARQVVDAVERLHPGENEGEGRLRTESASGVSGATGTVLVRRLGLPDDSLAGYDYAVTARRGVQGWAVESATKETICRRGVDGGLCV